ncbi:MAG TPA: carboxylesterase family protein [Steroidobacteraceae bacterium]
MSAIALVAASVAPAAEAGAARARVQGGVLVGAIDGGVQVFKGIPYAAPPVGALRFALPQPVVPWRGERAATAFGASCMQRAPLRNVVPESSGAQISEDCLTLNVWAPQTATKAPVMVWIHGGGNENGSSAVKYYDGAAFARDGIVLVSLNYRLGKLGFEPHNGEANFGLWDQVAALQWVKTNIASFGGDPANVTVFGESAGGEDTLALMTAAAARDLFQKAIVESGGGGWVPNPRIAQLESADHVGEWGVVADGHLLKESLLSAFAGGRAAHIPLIIGTNSEEGSLLGLDAHSDAVFPKLSASDRAMLKAAYGSQAAEDEDFARLVFRDGYFASEARWIAAKVSAEGSPAYLYRFNYVLSVLQRRRAGAFHGSEIPFVFNRMPEIPLSADDLRVEQALHGCWVAFARTGKPVCDNAKDWPTFGSTGSGKWMVFDANPSVRPLDDVTVLDLLQCRLAQEIPLQSGSCPPTQSRVIK